MPIHWMIIKDWCQQNNIKKDRFYYWHRKVREAAWQSETEPILTSQSFAGIPALIAGTSATNSFRAELTTLVGGTFIVIL